jgi:hypothetical protein
MGKNSPARVPEEKHNQYGSDKTPQIAQSQKRTAHISYKRIDFFIEIQAKV